MRTAVEKPGSDGHRTTGSENGLAKKRSMIPRKSGITAAEFYRLSNLIAAQAILENPERHRGAMLQWAERVMAASGNVRSGVQVLAATERA